MAKLNQHKWRKHFKIEQMEKKKDMNAFKTKTWLYVGMLHECLRHKAKNAACGDRIYWGFRFWQITTLFTLVQFLISMQQENTKF